MPITICYGFIICGKYLIPLFCGNCPNMDSGCICFTLIGCSNYFEHPGISICLYFVSCCICFEFFSLCVGICTDGMYFGFIFDLSGRGLGEGVVSVYLGFFGLSNCLVPHNYCIWLIFVCSSESLRKSGISSKVSLSSSSKHDYREDLETNCFR